MLRTSCAAPAALLAVAATTVLFAQPSSLFFTETAVQDVHLRMDDRDWRALRDHYLENTYYPAEFQWQSTRLREVSLRSYGNGSRNGVKPAFRIDFNRRVAGQEFIGLKSLILKNLAQDIPMLRERLAMLLFRRMNVPAPRQAYVRLTVNGEFWGLYIAIEPIDKRFLLTRFGEDDGYLYQYKWTFEYDLGDLGTDPEAYAPAPFQPQTHESDPAVNVLMDWIHAISRSSDEEFESAVGRYLDFDAMLTYLAIENFLGETDGFVGTVGVNNFYLCRLAGTTKFQILPWDKDTTVNWDAEPPFWRTETNVLVRRMLAVPRLRRLYLDKLLAVANSAGGAGGWFENKAIAQFNLIRPVALADPHKPFSNEEFLGAFDVVRYFMQTRADHVREEVALVAEP